jgi:hypothetical protein
VDEAKRQLRLAQSIAPRTTLGVESSRFLERLAGIGTK